MTQTQAQRLNRAQQIMERDGVQVCGSGWLHDGRRVYAVASRSEPQRWHLIVVNGSLLTCDCRASQYGRYCAHRAAVRARIVEERERDERNMGGSCLDCLRGW